LNKCDSRKILFGSDHPEIDAELSIKWILDVSKKLKFSIEKVKLIMGDNAQRIFDCSLKEL
jgi:predicted TIM-barrel fold metal-dependent hydrolase